MTRKSKIIFDLEPDEDGYPPIGSEGLNAIGLDDGTFILDNTPFFVTEVALGDRVVAEQIPDSEGRFAFSHVLEPSSEKAISIIFLADHLGEEIFQNLRARGCYCEYGEFGSLKMLAVSVPEACDYRDLRKYLMYHRKKKHLSFAELAV
ncbi:DUF4265 domain-containing protein [Enhygromyxa salina]|uniref:DUF4265 domain-containing protein n=1 Tax=Enhygromyxa salina TaxID=215803 RepID=UPI0006962869|nr:DUF4265 domain-containing protein [Enhygromyxa salina]